MRATPGPTLDARWREQAAAAQEAVLPGGHVAVSCPAPFGVGGLGRHLKEIVDALDRRGQPREVICESDAPEGAGRPGGLALAALAALAPVGRLSAAWRIWSASMRFDAEGARRLGPAEHLIGFNGTSLRQFAAARERGLDSIGLMAANSHFRKVIRQHALAHRQYPVERPWATRLLRRNLLEYARAQRIYVASGYVRDSFLAEGFSEEIISLFPLTPDPRFAPSAEPPHSDTFDILYVGGLTVHKGVPLLLDAFSRLAHADLRLVLVGGWKSRGMRRLLERERARDRRISVSPGDPLAHLRRARLCVHPAYEDGFAYAPAEALACGVPVLVSEDTGMKELIDPGRTGLVLPTGEVSALVEAIEAVYRGEILAG